MGIGDSLQGITDVVKNNPMGTAVAAGIAGVAIGAGSLALIGSAGKTSNKKRRTHTKRGWKSDRKRFNKSQKWEVAYRKRKRKGKRKAGRPKSKKGIHYTKKGQPYKIMANGRARFIKKSKRRSR